MAVILLCSCFFTRPTSLPSPPSYHFSDKPHVAGKLVSLLFKEKKFLSVIGDASRVIHQRFGGLHDLEGSQGFSQMPPPHGIFFGQIISRSGTMQGKVLPKSTAMTLFLTNAFMLTTPFKALAETCEADNSFFNMPLLLFVALIGATVGGLLARQRRGELQRLNDQLRQINTALRRQAKIESYAPNLSYAPVGSRISESEVIIDPTKEELISRLKTGKNFLRNQDPEKAYAEFKKALDLAQNLKDPIEEKKAARGLGASLQRQGKYREAIKYHSMVLEISRREGEQSGNTEAYGAIADCYTELGDLERAGRFYDQYIARLETD